MPTPDQNHPQFYPDPEPVTGQRAEDMAHPQEESPPDEGTSGTRRGSRRDTIGGSRRGSAADGDAPADKKKPNRLATWIGKLGLDAGTLITMFK